MAREARIHTYADGDDCTGLAALDPQDPNVVFISTNADPATGKPLIKAVPDHIGGTGEIFQGTTRDGGAKVDVDGCHLLTASSLDNIRPVIPVWRSESRADGLKPARPECRDLTITGDYTFEVTGLISKRS